MRLMPAISGLLVSRGDVACGDVACGDVACGDVACGMTALAVATCEATELPAGWARAVAVLAGDIRNGFALAITSGIGRTGR